MSKTYKVGQVIYIVVPNKVHITPAKVVAKHTIEQESGVVVKHTCQTRPPDDDSDFTFELESLLKKEPGCAFFESLDETEAHLMSAASQKIKQIIIEARKKTSHTFFSDQPQAQQPQRQAEETHAVMTLEDGTRVRVPRDLVPEA